MPTEQTAKELMTARDVAPLLGVSVRRVQALIRQKKLPAVKTGTRAVRIPRAAFETFLQRLNAEALASMEPTGPTLAEVIEAFPAREATEPGIQIGAASLRSEVLAAALEGADEAHERRLENFTTYFNHR